MFQSRGETKKDGVSAAEVDDVVENSSRLSIADLKSAAGVSLGAQIDAQSEQTLFDRNNIVVPAVRMSTARNQAIYPAGKAANVTALRDFLNYPKQRVAV